MYFDISLWIRNISRRDGMKMYYSLESGRHLFNSTSDSLFILILDSCIQLLFNTFNLFCQLISNFRCLSISALSILVCSLNLGVCSYWCGLSNWCCCYGGRCRDCKCRRCCINKIYNIYCAKKEREFWYLNILNIWVSHYRWQAAPLQEEQRWRLAVGPVPVVPNKQKTMLCYKFDLRFWYSAW